MEVLAVAWGGVEWEEQTTQVCSDEHLGTGRGTTGLEGAAHGGKEGRRPEHWLLVSVKSVACPRKKCPMHLPLGASFSWSGRWASSICLRFVLRSK